MIPSDVEKVITDKAEETHKTFRALRDKTNKEHPQPKDVKALADLLSGNGKLELWRDVVTAGHLAELMVIDNARATAAVKECWKQPLRTRGRTSHRLPRWSRDARGPKRYTELAHKDGLGP